MLSECLEPVIPELKVLKEKKIEPKKFSGNIKLYYQEFGGVKEMVIKINEPEIYAALEILHGAQQLELFVKYQNDEEYLRFYCKILDKINIYINRIKNLKRIPVEKWDWDWND